MDWRPDHVKASHFTNQEIDILQFALDVYKYEYETADIVMDRMEWVPVKDLMRKLEQMRTGH